MIDSNKNNKPLKPDKKNVVLVIILAGIIALFLRIIINIIDIAISVPTPGVGALIIIPAVLFCGLTFLLIKEALAGKKWAKTLLIILAITVVIAMIGIIYFIGFLCNGATDCCIGMRNCPG